MRYHPEDKSDFEIVQYLGAPEWMVEMLKLNPSYISWGPHEDYMMGGSGWNEPVARPTWSEGKFRLDELNEVVNFYFSIDRDHQECEACEGDGLNPESHRISDAFYDLKGRGGHWHDAITQDEVAALKAEGMLHNFDDDVTAEVVNRAERGRGMVHDAINRHILIRTRCDRLGVWGLCEQCQGNGYVFTAPNPRLVLTLWVIYPRKGCSRGWEILNIEREELPEVYAFLREAAARNAERFSRIPEK